MLKLVEYGQEVLIPRERYNEEDRIFLSKLQYEGMKTGEVRFQLRECHEGLYLRPLNHVGSIKLSSERINIVPRFNHDFAKLIKMILFTKDIKFRSDEQNLETTSSDNDFFEVVIALFLEEMRLLLNNGLFKKYVGFQENLKVIRGRIDFGNHIKNNFLKGDHIFCKYEELNHNILENQIVLRALNIAAYKTTDEKKRKLIRRYVELFSSICEPLRGKKVPHISYNRLNAHYKEAHYFSKLLIEQIGIDDIYSDGKHESRYSLLIDNNELFEQFVSKLCEKYLSKDYEVKLQWEIKDAIVNERGKCYRLIKPDIVLVSKSENPEFIIIDTKNKNYGKNKVYNEDIYQLAFYGRYFSKSNVSEPRIMIIYPKYANETDLSEDIFINHYYGSEAMINIKSASIDLNDYLELVEGENQQVIKEKLLRLLTGNIDETLKKVGLYHDVC